MHIVIDARKRFLLQIFGIVVERMPKLQQIVNVALKLRGALRWCLRRQSLKFGDAERLQYRSKLT